MSPILTAGTVAPNFTLRVTPDQNLTLLDLRGKPVILAFYPADWRPVCGDQMTLYNEILRSSASTTRNYCAFRSRGCGAMPPSPVTISCISRCSPISKPKGDGARKYRAYRASEGVCERALAYPVVNQVQRHFGGRMRIVFRHFPLTEVHPHHEIAAESAEFAGAAALFWEPSSPARPCCSGRCMTLSLRTRQAEHTDDLPDRRRTRASRNSNAECLGDGQYRVHCDSWAAYVAA
jgi:hypothetical protein